VDKLRKDGQVVQVGEETGEERRVALRRFVSPWERKKKKSKKGFFQCFLIGGKVGGLKPAVVPEDGKRFHVKKKCLKRGEKRGKGDGRGGRTTVEEVYPDLRIHGKDLRRYVNKSKHFK